MNAVVNTPELNWPARRPESWKYTDLKRLGGQLGAQLDVQPPATDEPIPAPLLNDALTAVWLDGFLQSQADALVLQTGDAADSSPNFDSLPASLSEAVPQQVYQLDLGAEVAGQVVQLRFAHSAGRDALSSVRLKIRVADGVHVTLLEEHCGGRQGLALMDLQLELGTNSQLQHIRLQHCATTQYLVARQSAQITAQAHLQQVHVDWGSRVSRLASQLDLAAPQAQVSYHALSGLTGRQHCDHQVEVRHMSPHCTSHLRARGILDDAGRQVFNGKIYVARDAQKTDSDQLLRNLLLSDKAEVDAKPELEIYADDVKCAHGSTVGRMDDAALFYLRSRGLDEATAKRLLMLSFAERILVKITLPELADYARQAFADHLSLRTDA